MDDLAAENKFPDAVSDSGGTRSSGVSELLVVLLTVSLCCISQCDQTLAYISGCSSDLRETSSKPFFKRCTGLDSALAFCTRAHAALTNAALFLRISRHDVCFGAIVLIAAIGVARKAEVVKSQGGQTSRWSKVEVVRS